jgi:hypothetical protein
MEYCVTLEGGPMDLDPLNTVCRETRDRGRALQPARANANRLWLADHERGAAIQDAGQRDRDAKGADLARIEGAGG